MFKEALLWGTMPEGYLGPVHTEPSQRGPVDKACHQGESHAPLASESSLVQPL